MRRRGGDPRESHCEGGANRLLGNGCWGAGIPRMARGPPGKAGWNVMLFNKEEGKGGAGFRDESPSNQLSLGHGELEFLVAY